VTRLHYGVILLCHSEWHKKQVPVSTFGAYISSLSHDILINQVCSRERKKKKKRLQITITRMSHITRRDEGGVWGCGCSDRIGSRITRLSFSWCLWGIDDGTWFTMEHSRFGRNMVEIVVSCNKGWYSPKTIYD
jgi:hypothetical protein